MLPNETIKSISYMISTKLFEAEDRRLDKIISSLNQRNKRCSDIPFPNSLTDGFLYEGNFYLPKDAVTRPSAGMAKTALHKSLQDEMVSFLQDKRLVLEEQGFIRQILHTLLKTCRTDQEIRDTLPECLVNGYPMARLPRRDEVAHTIRDNPRALRQFEKFLPKMELYSALKLLY